MIMKNEWIHCNELKKRWQHIFKTDEDFLPLMHKIKLFAFKYDMPESRNRKPKIKHQDMRMTTHFLLIQ